MFVNHVQWYPVTSSTQWNVSVELVQCDTATLIVKTNLAKDWMYSQAFRVRNEKHPRQSIGVRFGAPKQAWDKEFIPIGFIFGSFGFTFHFEDYILYRPGIIYEYTQSSNPITVRSWHTNVK